MSDRPAAVHRRSAAACPLRPPHVNLPAHRGSTLRSSDGTIVTRRCNREAWWVHSPPSATTPPPQGGVVVERIAVAYESRFSEYVRVATAIAGDPERGRDAVQDAFARAIAGCLAYRGDGPLEAWLWRAVTNAAHNQRRAAGSGRARRRDRGGAAPGAAARDGDGALRISSPASRTPARRALPAVLRRSLLPGDRRGARAPHGHRERHAGCRARHAARAPRACGGVSTPPLGSRARSTEVTANGIRQHCLDYGGDGPRS